MKMQSGFFKVQLLIRRHASTPGHNGRSTPSHVAFEEEAEKPQVSYSTRPLEARSKLLQGFQRFHSSQQSPNCCMSVRHYCYTGSQPPYSHGFISKEVAEPRGGTKYHVVVVHSSPLEVTSSMLYGRRLKSTLLEI